MKSPVGLDGRERGSISGSPALLTDALAFNHPDVVGAVVVVGGGGGGCGVVVGGGVGVVVVVVSDVFGVGVGGVGVGFGVGGAVVVVVVAVGGGGGGGGCVTSQQHASVSQRRICSDNFKCCHTEVEASDQTFHLTQSQYTDTWPTSPSADPIMPGAWQGSHWSANV